MVSETRKRQKRVPRLLIPALPGMVCPEYVTIATGIKQNFQILVLGIVPVPEEDSLSTAASAVRKLRAHLRDTYRHIDVSVRAKVTASFHPEFEITSYIAEQQIEMLLLPWSCQNNQHRTFVESVISHVTCDAVIANNPPAKLTGKLLILLRPGLDSQLALRLGLLLASESKYQIADIWILDDPGNPYPASQLEGIQQVLSHLPDLKVSMISEEGFRKDASRRMETYDLILMGGHASIRKEQNLLDQLALEVLDSPTLSSVVTKAGRRVTFVEEEELEGLDTISILVDKWFAENTFHADEFRNLKRLVQLKEERSVSISLALPALNEEETVEKVIRTIRGALMEEVPLIDEMVLIDSNSTDRTREIARALDIPVFIHQEILQAYGARTGKGEALWKSLFITRGDLLLWIDTDIVNIHPRFVYGLIGAILSRRDLRFVKGFYRRPIKLGNSVQAGGGGRVTELTARPLINLFFPALSGLVQPLSGEYGGMRETLERLPFSSGYGVETGLLIDILEEHGLNAIGQVDLVSRIHHNQPLNSLSKMSFAIIQTVMRKLDRRLNIQLPKDINRSMKIIRRQNDQYFLEVAQMAEQERPPMISIPEYVALHQDRLGHA